MYVCMYVCVCLFVNERLRQFLPNNAKFTQRIDECSGRVMLYIPSKTVQICLKKSILQKGVDLFFNYGHGLL